MHKWMEGNMEYFPILKITSISNYDKRSDRKRDRALVVTSHWRQAKPGSRKTAGKACNARTSQDASKQRGYEATVWI